jgi:DNA-binding transcriptional LysR family regulator
MESIYLKTFVEVVRCGNFSRAAETLHVTQSAVSRRIRFMEDQYGTSLIDRSGALPRPTDAGRLVYEKARRMLELEGELASELQKMSEHPPLYFACTRPFGIIFLPTIMKKFMARYEDKVDIKLSFATPPNILAGLRENRHDIIVIEHWDRIDFTPYLTVRLGLDEMVFVSSHRLGLPTPWVTVDELLPLRLYRRKDDCCSGKLLAHNMAAIGRHPNEFKNVLVYDDLHIIIESVCAGEGIALISKSLVMRQLEEGILHEHRVEGFCHSRKRTLVYRQEISQIQPLRYFISCVREAFGVHALSEFIPPPPHAKRNSFTD